MDNFEIRGPDGQSTEPSELGQVKKESYAGDFVHGSQNMGTEKDFRHVSQLWLDRCLTFDQALEDLSEGERFSEDVVIKAAAWEAFRADSSEYVYKDGRVDAEGRVVAEGEPVPRLKLRRKDTGQEYTPTPYAMGQLASWVQLSAGTIKDALEPVYDGRDKTDVLWPVSGRAVEDLARLINSRLVMLQEPGGGDREFMFRTWTDNNTLRSIHSKKYARINNCWYLETLKKLIPDGKLSHWRGDRDNMCGNILIPDTIRKEDDSDYGGMISVGNSEIGLRQLYETPSVFRAICMNGCIWDQEVGHMLKVRHVGEINLNELSLLLRKNLMAQIPLLDSNIDRVLSARDRRVVAVDMRNIFAAVSQEKGFGITRNENTGILKAYVKEQDILNGSAKTAFGVTQSLTRYGQELDNEGWVRFDELGGRMVTLSDAKWAAIVNRAASYTKDDLESILGLPAMAVSI